MEEIKNKHIMESNNKTLQREMEEISADYIMDRSGLLNPFTLTAHCLSHFIEKDQSIL